MQWSPVPVAALAVAAAAALALGGIWLFRRWRAMVDVQREQAQRAAVKKDNLARQKQRFQRALVVDSVNLELPPIKDMDVQPGPVRVEKIISQGSSSSSQQRDAASNPSQRGGPVQGLAGDSLRQWQQFMSASRAKEVTNVSGSSQRGGRGTAAQQAADSPYVALDDRVLADLSERIRRANDLTAAGEAPPPMPVITFEQLYANNHESDDEAMARRAAERKARWQQQNPAAAAPAGGTAAVPRGNVAARPPRVPKKEPATITAPAAGKAATALPGSKAAAALTVSKAAVAPAGRPRPKPSIADNPFAVGIVASSTSASAAAPSAIGPASIPGASSSTGGSARGGAAATAPESSTASRALPPRSETAVQPTAASSSGGRLPGRNPFLEDRSAPATATVSHVDTSEASGRDAGAASPPLNSASWRTGGGEQDAVSIEHRIEPASTSRPTEAAPALTAPTALSEEAPTMASTLKLMEDVTSSSAGAGSQRGVAPDGACQLPGPSASAVGGCREDSVPSVSEDPRREQDELVASPGRVKRQPAMGQLRTPETQAPALKRLMRRPSGTSPAAEEPTCRVVVPTLQLSESSP
ncbi:hypothetical protein PLESTF_001464800 [Pleodorina starrii]|nr:hypothetical protein PLESTF_001464800 [Pleodorina starrii]